jgi:multiple sugar transport system substrate-binding protein
LQLKYQHSKTFAKMIAIGVAVSVSIVGCSATAAHTAAPAKTTLTVWHYFSAPTQVKVMTDYASLFEKDNPGVTVKNVYVPYDNFDSKLIAAAGAKTGPDVVVYNGADAPTLAKANTLLSMNTDWSSFADKGKFPSAVIHTVNGKVFGAQGYVNLLGLWYNKDILDKLGVQPPTTMSQLTTDMAKAVAAGDQGITLCGLPQGQGEWQAYPWLSSEGFNYSHPTASALTKGLSLVADWVKEGYLSPEATTWDQTVPFQKFAAGGVAFSENGNWQIGTAQTTAKFNYGVVPLPLSSTGQVYLGGEGESIGKFSKSPSLAWKYLEETYYSKAGQLIALKDAGSIPSRTDVSTDPQVANNKLLKPFADEIKKYGAVYPSNAVEPSQILQVQLVGGQAWSSVIGSQSSPSAAATTLMASLKTMLR